jgi:hypothetical protein
VLQTKDHTAKADIFTTPSQHLAGIFKRSRITLGVLDSMLAGAERWYLKMIYKSGAAESGDLPCLRLQRKHLH